MLALAALAGPAAGLAAQTQVANVLPLANFATPPEGVDNWPRGVRSDLLLATDGNIYFAAFAGGDGAGAIGRLTPADELTTLYALADDGSEGVNLIGSLIQASDGHLYGTAYLGGEEGGGTLFRVTLAGVFTVLHNFGGGSPNAIFPYTGVAEGPDGLLYGTTLNGGVDNKGTIYRIAKDGTGYTVIHEFAGTDGENPEGQLVVGDDDWLYGTTMMGGDQNRGTVYRISIGGQHERLHSFPRLGAFNDQGLATNSDGANPRAGLYLSTLDGNFYGTTYQGGEFGYGSVFRITPAGGFSIVHSFGGPSFGGGSPLSRVTQDAAGNFYGTTEKGGYVNRGSAWRLSAGGSFELLHGFIGTPTDGYSPNAGLLAANGTIYGVSYLDNLSSAGSIYRLDTGTGGMLPVTLSVSESQLVTGTPITLTWNAPAGSTCTKISGISGWSGDAGISGTQQLTPGPGIYTFGVSCADADDSNDFTTEYVRVAYVGVAVSALPLQPVDGGGGVGSLSLWWLLLAAAMLSFKMSREYRASCP